MSAETWAELVGATDRGLRELEAQLEAWLFTTEASDEEIRIGAALDRVVAIRRPLGAALARPATERPEK